MILAKNNIILPLKNTAEPEYAILNPVSGSFDMMDENDKILLEAIKAGKDVDASFFDYLLERGYIYPSAKDEQKAIDLAFEEFNNEIDNTQIQLMLIPTYGCNLACTYCYQHGIDAEYAVITKEAVDAFFDYARKNFSHKPKKPFITLFGGEPLVNSPKQRAIIEYIVSRCGEEGYELAAVTNGNDFTEYVDILKTVTIKEMQFTLDGSRQVHNARRATTNKKGTFDNVIAGIAAAVDNGFPVNLRTVVDLENIRDIVKLAEYLDEKGWLDLPPERFKTQLGRNYELFECYFKPQHLMTQAELWAEYSSLSKAYPVLEKFHRPDFKGIRHMIDTGELYMASFDTCPAAKTEWVFDLNGEIYGCTASCGRQEYRLGTFYPEVTLDIAAVDKWKSRNVRNIDKCKSCQYDVICGGGCGVISANQNGGDPLTPDCRPIQELLETGVNHYISDIRRMTDELETEHNDHTHVHTDDCCCAPAPGTDDCCCAPEHQSQGCVVCGAELVYDDTPHTQTCLVCKESFETTISCPNGHYICDTCHGADILGQVKRLLIPSQSPDPVELILEVFKLPGLKMHGPEYHSIVPAVLVTAYQNKEGFRDEAGIDEAIRRGRDIKGGSCGYHGVCGAASGTGIAASVIEKATPLSGEERGNAMAVTGQALLDLSRYGGPRCCKRDCVSSIESFIEHTDFFGSTETATYVCTQFKDNKDCIGIRCPYFPQ